MMRSAASNFNTQAPKMYQPSFTSHTLMPSLGFGWIDPICLSFVIYIYIYKGLLLIVMIVSCRQFPVSAAHPAPVADLRRLEKKVARLAGEDFESLNDDGTVNAIIASHVIVGMDSTNPRPTIPGSIPWYWSQRAIIVYWPVQYTVYWTCQ